MICPHCGKSFIRSVHMKDVPPRDADRFWKRVKKSDGCWEFQGHSEGGYGRLQVNGRHAFAHVASWVIHNGPLPVDKVVAHSCDNRKCVRPDHLEAITQTQNMRDMVARGRDGSEKRSGDRNYKTKITEAQAVEICEALKNKTATIRSLAKKLGVTFNAVYHIALGKRRGVPASIASKQRRMPPEDVLKIRHLHASGVTGVDIGKQLGWGPKTISKVINGHTHKRIQLKEAA